MKTNSLFQSTMGLCAALIAGCATVSTSTLDPASRPGRMAAGREYTGPKQRVQVIRFGLPDSLVRKYPELGEKRVGWGLCNRLVDALYETGRFAFVEEKKGMIERIMRTWALSQSGAVREETAVASGGLSAPHYLLYAEVFDFSVSSSRTVVAAASREKAVTRIGIQIRMVDVASGEYIPASGTGEAVITRKSIVWASTGETFDQSTVGVASGDAVAAAVHALLRRMTRFLHTNEEAP